MAKTEYIIELEKYSNFLYVKEQVVRCKNCKHGVVQDLKPYGECVYCMHWGEYVRPNDFCSRGEVS